MGSSHLPSISITMNESPPHPSLQAQAAQKATLSIPCLREPCRLGHGLDSRLLATKFPWMPRSAFRRDAETVGQLLALDLHPYRATYREGVSSGSRETSEHLSASLGATIGCDFLSASVTGSYDHATMQSHNAGDMGSTLSRHASVRAGRLHFEDLPPLAEPARLALQSSLSEFHTQFGDYFVVALELGADIGCCLGISSDSSAESESTAITVTAHALFWDASMTSESSTSTEHAELRVGFRSYNTFNNSNETVDVVSPGDAAIVRSYAARYMQQTVDLAPRLQTEMKRLNLSEDSDLDTFRWSDCDKVVFAGLGVQYILLPFSVVPEVRELQAMNQQSRDAVS
ncbi:hypothetical protein LTR53_010993 [Teratosphaeriaceae sp. CCFEE 6253]|nr:hypothetical protein LTR53_010993 [Teratosphaeriaceae sp. CCFEE 6253]